MGACSSSPGACTAVDEGLDELTFFKCYVGQLSPPQPTEVQLRDKATPAGPILIHGDASFQRGPFRSLWVRPRNPSGKASSLLSAAALAEASLTRTNHGKHGAAVYLCVSEMATQGLDKLIQRGYHFYQHVAKGHSLDNSDSTSGTKFAELVYARWVGVSPSIPAYATSIEGTAGLVFSPPKPGDDPEAPGDKVLLVWEHGCWRGPSGAVDVGELKTETIAREIGEELKLELDDTFKPVYCGGWQAARKRDALINDNFSTLAVRVRSEEFAVDGIEINDAKWFLWKPLLEMWCLSGAPISGKLGLDAIANDARFAPIDPKKTRISNALMASLQCFSEGAGLSVYTATTDEGPTNVRQKTLLIGAQPSADKRVGALTTYIIDCGSKHTVVHVLRDAPDGSVHEVRKKRLTHHYYGNETSLSLDRDVLKPLIAQAEPGSDDHDTLVAKFLTPLKIELANCGRRQGDGSTVFIGATGGVRRLLHEHTERVEALLQVLQDAITSHFDAAVSFELLSEDVEARCEREAVRHVFRAFFEEKQLGSVGMLSGGGASCQFAQGDELASADLPMDSAQKSFATERENVASIRRWFEAQVAKKSLPKLSGSFVGVTMHEDVAQLGFHEELLTVTDAIQRIDQIVHDLVEKTGDGWDRAMGKWGDRAPSLWVIGAAGALRLRAILTQCFDESSKSQLYFAQMAPGHKGLKVSWPVGKKLLLLDAKRSASNRIRQQDMRQPSAKLPSNLVAATSHV